eukprot:m.25820 g.25820  ORF g.25820 m.25820 type:complete len:82 (-) comp7740_c0_seq1:1221-1466(-)
MNAWVRSSFLVGRITSSNFAVPVSGMRYMSNKRKEDPEKVPNETTAQGEHINPVTKEINGPKGPEPTRYGDWEKGGRCSDF